MTILKDILRNVASSVNSSSIEIQSTADLIDTFINSQDFNADRERSDKVSAELHTIYSTVQNYPQKLYTFLKCLRALLPILGPDVVISDWWDRTLLPALYSPLQPKDIVEEVKEITREVLTSETERVMMFRRDILELYLKESSMMGKAAGEGHGIAGEQVHAFWCRNLDCVLRGFGSAKTKDFFVLLNSYFIQQQYRLQVLNILGEFIQRQNFHIHQILETSLLDSLLTSLQRDTSTTLLSLSLTTLVMLLPHICTSVITYLPRLYIIFVRILCWDKRNSCNVDFEELIEHDMNFTEGHNIPNSNIEVGWDHCDSTFDNVHSTPPNCLHLFTILYGMFPCNTIEFLMNPTAWIKNMDYVTLYEEIEDDIIRARSVPLLRRHTLHPSLILSSAQKELSDTTRWMKLEPADVVAECIGFDTENALAIKHKSNDFDDFTEKSLKEADSAIHEFKMEKVRRSSQTISMQEIMDVHQALKSGADIVVGDDPWASKIISLTPDHDFSISQSSKSLSNTQASILFLQREIMLLRNELNFELYLKKQHLQHISRLHRDHVLDSRVEAERQNLYNTCRNLKLQLEKTQSAFNRQRDETANIKKKHVQWENGLNAKLKKYREENKGWKTEIDQLKQQLREANHTIKAQAKQIEDANAKNFNLENRIKESDLQLKKLNEYEYRIDQLTKQLLLWETDTRKFQEQKRHMEVLVSQWHKMEMMLETSEQETKHLRVVLSSQSCIIDDLKIKAKAFSQYSFDHGTTLEKQMRIWTFERDKRDKEFKKLETNYEKVKKINMELQSHVVELSAQIESIRAP